MEHSNTPYLKRVRLSHLFFRERFTCTTVSTCVAHRSMQTWHTYGSIFINWSYLQKFPSLMWLLIDGWQMLFRFHRVFFLTACYVYQHFFVVHCIFRACLSPYKNLPHYFIVFYLKCVQKMPHRVWISLAVRYLAAYVLLLQVGVTVQPITYNNANKLFMAHVSLITFIVKV